MPDVAYVVAEERRDQATGYNGDPQLQNPNYENIANPYQMKNVVDDPELASSCEELDDHLQKRLCLMEARFLDGIIYLERKWARSLSGSPYSPTASQMNRSLSLITISVGRNSEVEKLHEQLNFGPFSSVACQAKTPFLRATASSQDHTRIAVCGK